MKILITGGTGFIGKNLTPKLKTNYQIYSVGTKDYNLFDWQQAETMFKIIKPDIVIALAGKSGGIWSNKNFPSKYWFENMLIATNTWELSNRYGVKKLIQIIPGCTYPKNAESPISEKSMFCGFPDDAPACGSLPKAMSIIASYAYKKEFNFNSTILIPANLYGPHDIFDEKHSHVISALILKIHKAKEENTKKITLWGKEGRAIRDFMYVEDAVACIPYFIENDINFPSENPYLENICNISTGQGFSIKELAETIADIIGYNGEIEWDHSKPEGPLHKIFDNTRLNNLNKQNNFLTITPLKTGLVKTYEWYLENKK